MRKAILALVELSSKRTWLAGGDFIKKSLIHKLLEKGPQDAFFVSKIFEAARWDVDLYDAAENFRIGYKIDGVKNMCKNFHYSNMDEDVPPNKHLSVQVEKYTSRFSNDDARILVRNNENQPALCELYPRLMKGDKPMEPTFFACSFDYRTHRSFGDCREYKTALTLIGRAKFVPPFFALD